MPRSNSKGNSITGTHFATVSLLVPQGTAGKCISQFLFSMEIPPDTSSGRKSHHVDKNQSDGGCFSSLDPCNLEI